jgi:primosomal protein N'
MGPFGPRKMTGVALRCHDEVPEMATREALRLIDSEPVLDEQLLALGKWIAGYYCAPLGEVLRAMLPLAAEIRSGKIYSLTDSGRDAARQLLLDAAPEDGVAAVLRMLEARPLSAAYLAKKAPLGLRLSLAVNSSMAWPSYQAANRPRSLWYPRTVTGKDGCRRKSIRDLYFGGSEVGGL